MVTRSIVGRFLILAVLLVSLGVIAQAALIISRGPKMVAKASTAPDKATVAAEHTLTALGSTAANAATPPAPPPAATTTAAAAATDAQGTDPAPVRVVYPGPLGDAPMQPRKITEPAPAVAAAAPLQTAAVAPAPAAPPAPAVPTPEAAPTPPPLAADAAPPPPAVVVASADADAQPAPPSGHGLNLNSATVAELNRLGGGHIGHSIVQHRPYHSVEDLVKKRVVRRSVYEQIKDQVAAD